MDARTGCCDDPGCGSEKDNEERLEKEHFNSIVLTFLEYILDAMDDIRRRERAVKGLSENHASRLPNGGKIGALGKIADLRRCAIANQTFLAQVVDEHLDALDQGYVNYLCSVPYSDNLGGARLAQPQSSDNFLSKIKTTLHQCVREWSAEGAKEREACFGPIMKCLEAHLPVTESNMNTQSVLVPGVGLGR